MLNTSHGSAGPDRHPIPFDFGLAGNFISMHGICSGCWTSRGVSLLEALGFGGERFARSKVLVHGF
jgi:hypothetical protein